MVHALERECRRRDVLCDTSSRPERYGMDFLWRASGAWWGAQRKELHDYLASLEDGRLAREVGQMRAMTTAPVLLLEGKVQVANRHVVTNGWKRPFPVSALNKSLLTLRSRDVYVIRTEDVDRTAQHVLDQYEWSLAEGHTAAASRPKPSSDWGKLTNRDFQVHMLTSLPNVAQKTAVAILDTLGRCPITIDTTVKELCTVPGVGPRTARAILDAFPGRIDA